MYILKAKSPDHALKDVPDLRLEMVLVVMRPSEESRDEQR